ncbi:MAG: hypothetical protein OJF50_002893 [Nitrospira sp.]|nr:hypothetical protein [Nitrospira sp.]
MAIAKALHWNLSGFLRHAASADLIAKILNKGCNEVQAVNAHCRLPPSLQSKAGDRNVTIHSRERRNCHHIS